MEMGRQKKRRKQRKRKHQRRKRRATSVAAATMPPQPAEIWSSTYQRLVNWHQQQVFSLCRVDEEQQQQQQQQEDSTEEEEQAEAAKSVDFEDAFYEVDSDYLDFLEVTIKHKEELKRTREAAAGSLINPVEPQLDAVGPICH